MGNLCKQLDFVRGDFNFAQSDEHVNQYDKNVNFTYLTIVQRQIRTYSKDAPRTTR